MPRPARTPTGLLRTRQHAGAWRIDCANVEIRRHPLNDREWVIGGCDQATVSWLQRQQITPDERFLTRDAALRALSALDDIDPIPVCERPQRVTLIREGVTPIGTTYYRPSNAAPLEVYGAPGEGWQVTDGDRHWPARTLRQAADIVNQLAGNTPPAPPAI